MARNTLEIRFGQRVRDLREAASLSQEKLAGKAKLSRHYVSELECGKRNPSLTVIAGIAAALDVDLGEIVDF